MPALARLGQPSAHREECSDEAISMRSCENRRETARYARNDTPNFAEGRMSGPLLTLLNAPTKV